MNLAEKIKHYRKKAGLTQKGLAEKLGYDPNAVSNWERRKCEPNLETLTEIVKALNMDPSLLFQDMKVYSEDFYGPKTLKELKDMSAVDLVAYICKTQSLDTQCSLAWSENYQAFNLLSEKERFDQVLNAIEQFPEEDLANYYLEDMARIWPVEYVSVWDGYSEEIHTNAKFNRDTQEVFDIESVDVYGVEQLDKEYIILPNGEELDVHDAGYSYYVIPDDVTVRGSLEELDRFEEIVKENKKDFDGYYYLNRNKDWIVAEPMTLRDRNMLIALAKKINIRIEE
jgi:transcriptional regulator with XRE-family HTH domain